MPQSSPAFFQRGFTRMETQMTAQRGFSQIARRMTADPSAVIRAFRSAVICVQSSGNPRRGQVTVEYFILFTAVAVLSIAGIAALRNENVGLRKTVGDFMTAAATKIAHDDVELPAPPPPPSSPDPTACPEGQCRRPAPSCGGIDIEEICPGVCGTCDPPPPPEGGNR